MNLDNFIMIQKNNVSKLVSYHDYETKWKKKGFNVVDSLPLEEVEPLGEGEVENAKGEGLRNQEGQEEGKEKAKEKK